MYEVHWEDFRENDRVTTATQNIWIKSELDHNKHKLYAYFLGCTVVVLWIAYLHCFDHILTSFGLELDKDK